MAKSSAPVSPARPHKPAPAPPPKPAPPSDKTRRIIREKSLLQRSACARLLEVSPATVANYQRAGLLPAVVLDGIYYSSRADVVKLHAQRAQENAIVRGRDHRPVSDAARAGAIARTAFELLGSGVNAAELVTRLSCTPDEARKLAHDYAELRAMTTGAARDASIGAVCVRCQRNAARICAACVETAT